MARFRDLFKRSDKSSKKSNEEILHVTKHLDLPQNGSTDIASLPAAGMYRTATQSSYVTSYVPTHASSTLSQQQTRTSITTGSSCTAVDSKYVSVHGESQWKGKPMGKAYDKREELTEADEDAWARMAM